MKRLFTLFSLAITFFSARAQFGYQGKEQLESIKDKELIVVLSDDTADMCNPAIERAVRMYWKATPSRFVRMAASGEYAKKKEGYIFMVLVKGPGAKLKCKCLTTEIESTGLLVTSKFKKGKMMLVDILASSLIDAKFGTTQEEFDAQFIRAVQFLQNFFDYVGEAENDKQLNYETMQKRYPGDKSLAEGKKLLIDKKLVDEKQKEGIEKAFDGEVEYVDAKDIAAAVTRQDENVIYWFAPAFEQETHRMFVTAKDGRIITYEITGPEKGMVTAKDVSKLFKK